MYDLYSSLNIILVIRSRRMRWAQHVACMGEIRNAYKLFVAKPEEKRKRGRTRHRWEDNIKTDLQQVGWGMDWVDVGQDRDRWRAFINAIMNLRVPYNAGYVTSWGRTSFSRTLLHGVSYDRMKDSCEITDQREWLICYVLQTPPPLIWTPLWLK